jgi:hypothetical protein
MRSAALLGTLGATRMPSSHVAVSIRRNHSKIAGDPSLASSSSPPTYSSSSLVDEIHRLLMSPLAMGYLFRSISAEAKSYLTVNQLSLEQFLLRNPHKFAVFQEPGVRTIMASRASNIPPHAMRGTEVTSDELFGGNANPEIKQVLNVLKYVPNEWAAFSDLGVPETIRVHVMMRKAKAYFERFPQYFEVKAQGINQHTFFVRRALALQKQVEGGSPPTAGGACST